MTSKYNCILCNYNTNIKCNYDKHNLTKKHIKMSNKIGGMSNKIGGMPNKIGEKNNKIKNNNQKNNFKILL